VILLAFEDSRRQLNHFATKLWVVMVQVTTVANFFVIAGDTKKAQRFDFSSNYCVLVSDSGVIIQ